jgi:hypothetical protein
LTSCTTPNRIRVCSSRRAPGLDNRMLGMCGAVPTILQAVSQRRSESERGDDRAGLPAWMDEVVSPLRLISTTFRHLPDDEALLGYGPAGIAACRHSARMGGGNTSGTARMAHCSVAPRGILPSRADRWKRSHMPSSRSARPARGGALTVAPRPAILLGRSAERTSSTGRRRQDVEERSRSRRGDATSGEARTHGPQGWQGWQG